MMYLRAKSAAVSRALILKSVFFRDKSSILKTDVNSRLDADKITTCRLFYLHHRHNIAEYLYS